MGFWNKIFGKSDQQKVGGMEDFMTLIRVYFQAAMASDLGITNLAALLAGVQGYIESANGEQ